MEASSALSLSPPPLCQCPVPPRAKPPCQRHALRLGFLWTLFNEVAEGAPPDSYFWKRDEDIQYGGYREENIVEKAVRRLSYT